MDTLRRRAFAVFENALEQPEPLREQWLQQECGKDGALALEVRRLLRADALAEKALPTMDLARAAASSPLPERVGAYRITGWLGEGGMGVVLLGERDDGLFDQQVAVKLMRPSLLPEIAQRLFEKERRALARLSHRNIAYLFDGGVDAGGAPYFVMELVRGVEINAYCTAHALSLEAVVALVIEVCSAVQHAHQNLVVHADLKPANILVDQLGQVKILDFGVAHILLDPEISGEAEISPRTPVYSSPARMLGAAPAPSDDVYALGVILWQLSTGLSPNDDAVSSLRASEAMTSAPHPGVFDSRRRARSARGDLDEIIETARAKSAADRYASAEALGEDLRRWLAHRPRLARQHDRIYALGKFMRRRRIGVGAGVAALTGVLGALVITTNLYVEADQARTVAEARFNDVRGLARYLLSDVYDSLAQTPGSLGLRRDIAEQGQDYLRQLAATPSANYELGFDLVEGFIRLADIQAGRDHSNLGENDAALDNLARADALARQLRRERSGDGSLAAAQARIALQRAALLMNVKQDFNAADHRLLEMQDFVQEARSLGAPELDVALLEVAYGIERSRLLQWQGRFEDAQVEARLALGRLQEREADWRGQRRVQLLTALAMDAYAEALYYADDVPGAEREYSGLVRLVERLRTDDPGDMELLRQSARARWSLATTIVDLPGREGDALRELELASAEVERLCASEPSDQTAQRMRRIILAARAQALAANGRFFEAVALLHENVAQRDAVRAARPNEASAQRDYAVSLTMLGDIYAARRDSARACPLYVRALAEFNRLGRESRGSSLDESYSLRLIGERQRQLCQ